MWPALEAKENGRAVTSSVAMVLCAMGPLHWTPRQGSCAPPQTMRMSAYLCALKLTGSDLRKASKSGSASLGVGSSSSRPGSRPHGWVAQGGSPAGHARRLWVLLWLCMTRGVNPWSPQHTHHWRRRGCSSAGSRGCPAGRRPAGRRWSRSPSERRIMRGQRLGCAGPGRAYNESERLASRTRGATRCHLRPGTTPLPHKLSYWVQLYDSDSLLCTVVIRRSSAAHVCMGTVSCHVPPTLHHSAQLLRDFPESAAC